MSVTAALDVVQAATAAFHEGDDEAFVALIDPRAELRPMAGILSPVQPYLGQEGARQWLQELRARFIELHEVIDRYHQGDGWVVAVGHIEGIGHKGELPAEAGAWYWEVDDGRVVRMEAHRDEADALARVFEQTQIPGSPQKLTDTRASQH